MNAGILTTFHFFINALDFGTTGTAVHVSQSAVSQRAAAAGLIEAERAAELATILTERALEAP